MALEKLEFLVTGGQATGGPPLGPSLGPLGVNIGEIVSAINQKTQAMDGMDVPITLVVDTDSKEFEVTVGTPPVSALLKKELNLEKGSGSPKLEKVADTTIDRIIKIAQVKEDIAPTTKSAVNQILGSCVSMGIIVEGQDPREVIKEVDEGKYDGKISGKKELEFLSKEELAARKKELEKEAEKAKAAKKAREEELAEELGIEEKPAEEVPAVAPEAGEEAEAGEGEAEEGEAKVAKPAEEEVHEQKKAKREEKRSED